VKERAEYYRKRAAQSNTEVTKDRAKQLAAESDEAKQKYMTK